jgi:hypothetical protein
MTPTQTEIKITPTKVLLYSLQQKMYYFLVRRRRNVHDQSGLPNSPKTIASNSLPVVTTFSFVIVNIMSLHAHQDHVGPADNNNDSDLSPATDHQAVESMLAKEMNRLSVKERGRIQEEIHGVGSMVPEESPLMVQSNLQAMQVAIDNIPGKNAYNQAIDLYSRQLQQQLSLLYNNKKKNTNLGCYVYDLDLRMRFLRYELWDPIRAARRFIKYLDLLVEYFGPETLLRPLRYSDLCKESRQIMRRGNWQVLSSRDSTGRIVLAHLGWISSPTARLRVKIIFYMLNAVSEDVESQKRGCVVLMSADVNALPDIINQAQRHEHANVMDGLPVRGSAVHFCFPNTPFSRIIRAGIILTGHNENHVRSQLHMDDLHRPETQYRLMTYGIPIQVIPCTSSGVIKTKYHLQWIKSRMSLDRMRESGTPGDVVIHPGNDDVLFSQGGSKTKHLGNVIFRSVLERYMKEYQSTGLDWDAMKEVRGKVIKDIEASGGKFLMMDKNMNWWVPISDPLDLAERITSAFYYQAKKMGAFPKAQTTASGSTLFLPSNKRQKLEGEGGCCSPW